MKIISLFSGIGMQELGFDKAKIDYKLINYCEFDSTVAKAFSLVHNVSENKNLGDITKLDEKRYFQYLKQKHDSDIDIIISSFPCQSFSTAGNRKGFSDPTRGTLFFDTMRIVNEIKPKIVIFENVKGIINHDKKNTIRIIEDTMQKSNYKFYHTILNAVDFNVAQNRERWFGVGIREDIFNNEFIFPEKQTLTKRVFDILEKNIKNRKVAKGMKPILKQLHKRTKPLTKYSSKVGIKKVYDGIVQGDFTSGFTRTSIYSVFGTSPTLTKSNEHHFFELCGKLTPKERMRLMGVDDIHTDKLINNNFNNRSIDSIAGNGIVVDVFAALIKKIQTYLLSV